MPDQVQPYDLVGTSTITVPELLESLLHAVDKVNVLLSELHRAAYEISARIENATDETTSDQMAQWSRELDAACGTVKLATSLLGWLVD